MWDSGRLSARGHELNITDREALKGTSWDQYYEEIQEGIEWINRQEAEDIFIRSEDGFKLHGRLWINQEQKERY